MSTLDNQNEAGEVATCVQNTWLLARGLQVTAGNRIQARLARTSRSARLAAARPSCYRTLSLKANAQPPEPAAQHRLARPQPPAGPRPRRRPHPRAPRTDARRAAPRRGARAPRAPARAVPRHGCRSCSASSASALLPRAQTNLTISCRDTSWCATPPVPCLSTESFSRGCAAVAAALTTASDPKSSAGVSGESERMPPMVKTATEWPVSAANALSCGRGGAGRVEEGVGRAGGGAGARGWRLQVRAALAASLCGREQRPSKPGARRAGRSGLPRRARRAGARQRPHLVLERLEALPQLVEVHAAGALLRQDLVVRRLHGRARPGLLLLRALPLVAAVLAAAAAPGGGGAGGGLVGCLVWRPERALERVGGGGLHR